MSAYWWKIGNQVDGTAEQVTPDGYQSFLTVQKWTEPFPTAMVIDGLELCPTTCYKNPISNFGSSRLAWFDTGGNPVTSYDGTYDLTGAWLSSSPSTSAQYGEFSLQLGTVTRYFYGGLNNPPNCSTTPTVTQTFTVSAQLLLQGGNYGRPWIIAKNVSIVTYYLFWGEIKALANPIANERVSVLTNGPYDADWARNGTLSIIPMI